MSEGNNGAGGNPRAAPVSAEELEKRRKRKEQAQGEALAQDFAGYGYVSMPGDAIEPILDHPTRRALSEWMAEMNSVTALAAVGMKPRSRALLDGPPGCGKTTLAHHVAMRLGFPMVTVLASSIIQPYVGESSQRIAKLFELARKVPDGVVLFLDELDAIARNRADFQGGSKSHDDGLTISLLAELDRHQGMVFAATNQPDGIDAAVTRRFDLRVNISLPGELERIAIVKLYLKPLKVSEDIVEAIADEMDGGSPALIKDVCEAIKRGLVLGPKLKYETGLGALVRRAVQTIKPHDMDNIPRLWRGVQQSIERLDAAAEGHWPPAMPA